MPGTPSTTTDANATTVSAAPTAALLSAPPLWIRLADTALPKDATGLDVERATTLQASARATRDTLVRSARRRPTVNKKPGAVFSLLHACMPGALAVCVGRKRKKKRRIIR